MEKNVSNIISSFCSIYLLKDEERRNVFNQFIELCNNRSSSVRDEEIFTGLNSIKLYFYNGMPQSEHAKYIECCLKYIKQEKEFYYQLLETLSVIYKELSSNLQNSIFDVFTDCFQTLLASHRGITTISIFIKNTHKVYSPSQTILLNTFMDLLKARCVGELLDTYEYCVNNINRNFVPNTNKILLLIPEFQTATSFVQPPLCFLSVGSQLQNEKIPFDLLDNRVYSYSINQLTDIASQYDVIACTSSPLDQVQTYFLDYRYSIFVKTINILQSKISNSQKIIVCGAHSTVRSDIVCRDIKPDIIIKGEYDIQLFCLLKRIHQGLDIEELPNLLIRNSGSFRETIVQNEQAHPTAWADIKINYGLVDPKDYFGYHFIGNTHVKKMRHAVVQATRGCPFHCIFCYNFYTHSVRYKKIEILIMELLLMEKLGFEEFFFIDQTFTINKSYVQELCKYIIDKKIKLRWTCETRIELVDEETIKLMKEAGCVGIWFGIESFDEGVLNINKKGYVESDYIATIDLLKKYGIDYRAFIMLGMKGDTKETLQKTIDTIVKNKIHISKTIVRCKLRYGTELFSELPIEKQTSITSFEALGIYNGNLSSLSSGELSNAEQQLMRLNRT